MADLGTDARGHLTAGEEALAAGDPERAASLFEKAITLGVDDGDLARLSRAYGKANAQRDRHRDTLAWIESELARTHTPAARAVLLQARVSALRQFDTRAVLDLADEALEAASAAGDLDAYARVLADASFAAYRRGDVRAADRFAGVAAARVFSSPRSIIDALRSRMFAATASEQLEASLGFSREIRDRFLHMGDMSAAANESNNIAEGLLRMGHASPAMSEAERGRELGQRSGHRPVAEFAQALLGVALAESGDLGMGIARLRLVRVDKNEIFAADLANLLSYYLVERGEGVDLTEAGQIATAAVERAATAGVSHCLTTLLATQARAHAAMGRNGDARATLARARSAAYAADATSEQHLSLAMGEVYPPGDPARSVSLNAARARLLRSAGRREDPRAYLLGVRLHRRILEISGGVPQDLPQPA